MDSSKQIMTRYLLGELSESEQAALEEKYFTDPQVFEQVLETESELVDDYVRDRLPAQARERFEGYYLSHPQRRERMKFADALANKVDQMESHGITLDQPVGGDISWWKRLRVTLSGEGRALRFSIALASLLIMLGGIWLFVESLRLRRELAQTQASQSEQERRARELEQQFATERRRAEELAAELERLRGAQPEEPQPSPEQPESPIAPTFATLLLTVGGTRSTDTGPPQSLVIPQGTAQARVQINLKDQDYPSYSFSLQRVGGEDISRGILKPRPARSGASLILNVPAGKFSTGDYMLTLSGVNKGGDVEELSKMIFRVEKR